MSTNNETNAPNDSSNLDGVGLWNSFTRSFATPLLAVYDLLDNSFDATHTEKGKIHIELDKDDEGRNRGFIILNDCVEPVGSLTHALTLFKSTKGTASDKIGENGVGVKQGCATLSDLSFVISRDIDQFGLGIVARDLQTSTSINFPSFSFIWDETTESLDAFFMRELENIFSPFNSTNLHQIISKYGDGDAQKGIREITKHFIKISTNVWSKANVDHVFGLVIFNLKHGQDEVALGVKKEGYEDERDVEEDLEDKECKTESFLAQLEQNLPGHYLHVPNSFDFKINDSKLCFSFWQERLCEMAQFTVNIDKLYPHSQSKDMEPHQNQYMLNVYIGFDAIRGSDKAAAKTGTLLYHSRRTGRLIKVYNDARSELRLSSGGTQYCQGLTIIVDDVDGNLPLNPTKQDFAFSEESRGTIHQENLKIWLGAVTKVYYTHYLEKCNGQKQVLTDLVSRSRQEATILTWRSNKDRKSIDECNLITFSGISWIYRPKSNTINVKNKKFSINQGSKNMLQLPFPQEQESGKETWEEEEPPRKKPRRKKSQTKKNTTVAPSNTYEPVGQRGGKRKSITLSEYDRIQTKLRNVELENTKLQKINHVLRKELEKEEERTCNLAEENKYLVIQNNKLRDEVQRAEASVSKVDNSTNGDLKSKLEQTKLQLDFYKLKAKRLTEENTSLESMVNRNISDYK